MKNTVCLLKVLLLITLVATNIEGKAQLVYLGDDETQKKFEQGYELKVIRTLTTSGFVTLNDKYYFTTPNGNVYETDGTEGNTKTIKQFKPQNLPYLASTNKYVYFGYSESGNDIKTIVRYSPSTGIKFSALEGKYNQYTDDINGIRVPGKKSLVSEIFTNYDKDALLIRHFANDKFYIYKIDDNNPNPDADIVFTYPLDMKNVNTPVDIATTLETFKNEVYFNGRTKPTGVYETSIRIFKPTDANQRKYEFKTGFELLNRKTYPYFGFYRTPNNMYSLLKVMDSIGNYKHQLFVYNGKSISSTNGYFSETATDFATQKMGDDIYISFKGNLWKFNEPKSNYDQIIKENNPTKEWDEIAKGKRFLNVGNYYLYRRNGKLSMYDATLKIHKDITAEALAQNRNYFTLNNIYAYEGKNCFYFTQYTNSVATFIKYNPVNNTYTPIEFPAFKKQKFEEIKAIYQEGNKFIFLTLYLGKKDKSIFKMFMYTEEGLPLTQPKTTVTTIVKNEPKLPISTNETTIDTKNYNLKQLSQQIAKIVNNQGNQFADITGESIPSDFNNKKSSTVLLDGFKPGVIIDYASTSSLYRYEAVTASIKGKANALAFLDLLDKEVQKLTASYSIKRVVDSDLKVNKIVHFIFTDSRGYNTADIKFLELQAYCGSDFEDPEDAIFNIYIRMDKPARR